MKKILLTVLIFSLFTGHYSSAEFNSSGTNASNSSNNDHISISLESNPILKVYYDSKGNEMSLGSNFIVKITAPSNTAISVQPWRFNIDIRDSKTNLLPIGIGDEFSFYKNKLSESKVNSFTNATKVQKKDGTAYKISAGATATFDISSYLINTKLLPPGNYYEKLSYITYYVENIIPGTSCTTSKEACANAPSVSTGLSTDTAPKNSTNTITLSGTTSNLTTVGNEITLQNNDSKKNIVSSGKYNFGTTTLKNGSRGESVKELQRFLNKNLSLGLVVDGNLGPKTITIIKKWQKENGLTPDGLIGDKTKKIMNNTTQ